MIRAALVEQILRQVYGTFPSDDSTITPNLVNQLINQGIGLAIKQQYRDSVQLDGVGYINNSFYTTFKGLPITADDNFLWKVELPQVPYAVGKNEGVSTLRFKDSKGKVSKSVIWLSEAQVGYFEQLQPIPNQTLAYYQGNNVYIKSTSILNQYTATVTIISGGNSTDLNSNLQVPDDYIPIIVDYVVKQLTTARMQIQDATNDGTDAIRTN
jgi:hypothetical protein